MYTVIRHHFYRVLFLLMLIPALPFSSRAQDLENPPLDKGKPGSIVFLASSSFKEAMEKAQAQNKYIFVDAYASWCGPCKLLKATTFKNKKAADFYNANFINVSIDMEKGEGPDLASVWGIQAYPTLIIFDPKGKAVLGNVGYINGSDLLRFGKQALGQTK